MWVEKVTFAWIFAKVSYVYKYCTKETDADIVITKMRFPLSLDVWR
jgi:hypothetical protein